MKNIICVVVIVLIHAIVAVSAIPTPSNNVIVKNCADVGEFCQNSWDCCSNRCLSFSYKCLKEPSPSTFAPNTNNTHVVIDTVEELVNRFGSDDNETVDATPTTVATLVATSTSTSSSVIDDNSNKTQCIGIGYECADSSQCCSNDCLHYSDIHICIQRRNPTVQTACLWNGQKCYRNEECCTNRCHGYLHQCVT